MEARRRLRLEPWGVGYGGSWQDTGQEQGEGETAANTLDSRAVEIEVPLDAWRGLRPTAPAAISKVLFLDGVRRIEARGLLDDSDGQTFAALGSCAVGAVECSPAGGTVARAAIEPVVERWCAIATDRLKEPDLEVRSMAGAQALVYRMVAAKGDDQQAPIDELQRLMREAESRMATRLRRTLAHDAAAEQVAGGALLVCDGPRPLLGADERVVGYLKSLQQQRLPPAAFAAVRALEEGERSPIYVVGSGPHARFEWYLRLRDPRPWLHSLAGAVRLQAHAGEEPSATLGAARQVADWSASYLPRFATRAHQDARAPQQLLPVRALEENLRRRLGNAALLRRRIEVALAEGTGES